MKKQALKSTVILLALTLILTFAFGSSALADTVVQPAVQPSLNSLVIADYNGVGGSQNITVSPDMAIDVDYNWNTVRITPSFTGAEVTSSAGGVIENGVIILPLSGVKTTTTITVRNDDSTLTQSYQLTINRYSDELNFLSVNGVTFNGLAANRHFSLTVPKTTTTVPVAAVAKSDIAIVKCQDETQNGTSAWQVPLHEGVTPIIVKVYSGAPDNPFKSYIIDVTRVSATAGSNANLSNLEVTSGSTPLLGNFRAGATDYNVTVPFNATSISFRANPEDSKSRITIDGESVGNNSSYTYRNLPTGTAARQVQIVVTAEDLSTTKTYNVMLRIDQTGSTDTKLSALTARLSSTNSPLSPAFTPTTSSYSLTVPYNASYVTFSGTANSNSSKVAISESSSNPFSVNDGYSNSSNSSIATPARGSSKTVYIHVQASNGGRQTYTVSLTRSNSDSNDDSLRGLTVRYGSTSYNLMPTFNYDTYKYYVAVPFGTNYINIQPTASDSNAMINVAGNRVNSGSNSNSISLSSSSNGNTIYVDVTSPSGTDSQRYTLYIYRGGSSSNTNYDVDEVLLRAGTSSGSQSRVVSNPVFSNSTTSYQVALSTNQKYFSLSWDPNNTDSTAYLIYDDAAEKLSRNSYSDTLRLVNGKNTVKLRVYSPDNSRYRDFVYSLNVGGTVDDALLTALSAKADDRSVSLSPTFNKNTRNYTLNVDKNTSYLTFKATLSDTSGNLTVNGVRALSGYNSNPIAFSGSTKIVPIEIISSSGNTMTYNVVVNRQAGSSNRRLVLRIDSRTYLVDGTQGTLLAAPFMYKNRTMVPIRFISENLDATVGWNEKTQTVTINKDGKTLKMVLGKTDKAAGLDVAPMTKNYTTFVPVRYVTENLGAQVEWNQTSQEVTIKPLD